MFDQFHQFASLPNNFTFFFVPLISKVKYPIHLGDSLPIFLVVSLYKILAKVLVSRFPRIMDKLISSIQPAFLKGSLLVDGMVALNEIVYLTKKGKKSLSCF